MPKAHFIPKTEGLFAVTIDVVRTSVLHPVACINLAYKVWSSVNNNTVYFCRKYDYVNRSYWPRDLIRHFVATRLLNLWIRIPSGHGCLSLLGVVCCQVEVSASE